MASREFREDLFYRLNVVRIQIPPLRDRRDDISLLVNYFLKKISQLQGQKPRAIAPEAVSALERYHWPGNVRELENTVRRALVVAKTETILLQDLPPEVTSAGPMAGLSAAQAVQPDPSTSALAEADLELPAIARLLFDWAKKESGRKIIPAVERELVINALAETKGNQVQAAKLLGITRATLRKRVAKFNIRQELSVS